MITKVTIRRRPISEGMVSLYLDYYPPIRDPETMKMVHREYLRMYIYHTPANEIQKEYNDDMIMKAEGIRSIRVQQIINEEYGFLDKHKQKVDFLAYFNKIARKKYNKWMIVYKHFENFVDGQCIVKDVTVDLCRKFREYLLNVEQIRNKGVKLAQNSASGYFATFQALLNQAYQDKLLRENINDFLKPIEWKETKREYLTLDEIKKLAATPCDIPILKTASLFSCMTGLRISDILALQWENIVEASEGGYSMRIRTEKTETEATLPISASALKLCGERDTGKVFKGLERQMTGFYLKKWIKKAGIDKHITFHCFRHTFATLQIALGTDIYTVSKMLTHSNVSTTQIYADLVNEKKRESAEKIVINIID